MSAFVVNKSHINAMLLSALHLKYGGRGLSWYHNGEHHQLNELNASQTGQMLLDENINSVGCRYEDSEITDLPGRTNAEWLIPFEFRFTHHIPKALEAIKITECYMYQSCEHSEWEASEAKTFCEALISHKISELPGYDDALWEWEDSDYEESNLIRLA